MRKTRIVLAVVVLVVLLAATPALAIAKGGKGGTSFNLYGTIEALDDNALTIDVLVETPLSLSGDTITVVTTETTRFKECDDSDSYRINFGDLQKYAYVRVSGVVSGGVYIASSVIQYP